MKRRWQRFTDEIIGKKKYFLVDASVYSFYQISKDCIKKYVKGKVLDAGAGRLAMKFLLYPEAEKYYSMDKYIARKNLDVVGDLNKLPFKGESFDVVTCFQVIEHTLNPRAIIYNLAHCLKINGILILSAPHVSYLHGEPDDYYRFTQHGLRYLVQETGLEVLEIVPAASLFGYLVSLVSDFILAVFYKIPLIFPLIFFINSFFARATSKIDRVLFKDSPFAINYILVARK